MDTFKHNPTWCLWHWPVGHHSFLPPTFLLCPVSPSASWSFLFRSSAFSFLLLSVCPRLSPLPSWLLGWPHPLCDLSFHLLDCSSVGHLYLRISWAPDLHSQLLCMPHIQIWGADCWVREQFVFADCQQNLFISVFMITLGDKYEWHMVTGFEMLYSQSSRKVWLFFLFWILTHSKQKEL
jgi:hypothetical protein